MNIFLNIFLKQTFSMKKYKLLCIIVTKEKVIEKHIIINTYFAKIKTFDAKNSILLILKLEIY